MNNSPPKTLEQLRQAVINAQREYHKAIMQAFKERQSRQ